MRNQPGPEAEETPPQRDLADRLQAMARWLQRPDDELLYTPDALGEAAMTSYEARYYYSWGAGGLGVLAILRFPLDARHPETQQPYAAYAVGESFPFSYEGQSYRGRVIERQVSRADGLVELHVQALCGEGI
jgi:hypothetical protein